MKPAFSEGLVCFDGENEVREGVCDTSPLHNAYENEEAKELAIVVPTYASTKPLTVMVESVDAVPAKMAMERAFRPEDHASMAVLQAGHMRTIVSHYKLMHTASLAFPASCLQVQLGSSSQ